MLKLIGFGLVLVLAACSSTKHYVGPTRPDSELALLERDLDAATYFADIDGKFRGLGYLDRVEFLPGRHTVQVLYTTGVQVSTGSITLAFDAVMGHVYEVKSAMRVVDGKSVWTAWIEDKSNEQVVSQEVR